MCGDQDPHGILPTTTTITDELHRQPPSSSTHHLPGFTALPLPQTTPVTPITSSDVSCISLESDLASAIERAIFKIRDAVAAATTGQVLRTKSDTTSSEYHKHPTATAKRHPLRRTVSDAITSPVIGTRKVCQSSRSRTTVPEVSKRGENPQIKRLKEMKEMMKEIEERCRDFRRESEIQQDVGDDDNSSEAIEEHKEVREQCVGFKRIDEGGEECIGFNRLDDGALRIQMHCSCRKHFEILHNHIGCFYRLI